MIEQITAEEAFKELLSYVEKEGFSKIAVILKRLNDQGRIPHDEFGKLEKMAASLYDRLREEGRESVERRKRIDDRIAERDKRLSIYVLRESFRQQ